MRLAGFRNEAQNDVLVPRAYPEGYATSYRLVRKLDLAPWRANPYSAAAVIVRLEPPEGPTD